MRYCTHADRLIDEMRQNPLEEIEINGVRLYTKNTIDKRLQSRDEYADREGRNMRHCFGLWNVLNTAAIIALAIMLLRR